MLCAFNALFVPFQFILSPSLALKSYRRSGKPEVSQRVANDLCVGANPPLAAWISDFINNIAVSLFVSFFYPIAIPIGFVGCFLQYWLQKYAVLNVCRKPDYRFLPFELMGKWNYLIILWAGLCLYIFGKQELSTQFIYVVVGWIPLSTIINNGLQSIIKVRNKHHEYQLYMDQDFPYTYEKLYPLTQKVKIQKQVQTPMQDHGSSVDKLINERESFLEGE